MHAIQEHIAVSLKKFIIEIRRLTMESVDKEIELMYEVIKDRQKNPKEGSYTAYLFEKGLDKILKKVGEESSEVIIASKNDDNTEVINEVCDLAYHIIVLLAEKNIDLSDVEQELRVRRGKICNLKQERRPIEKI